MFRIKFLFIILLYFTMSLQLLAAVDPPNYNFSLDELKKFMPGTNKVDIEKTAGAGEPFFKNGEYYTIRYDVSHLRYRFPIFVQFKNDIVTDFHASLPRYFLHDIFHQSLINRIGKQNIYKNSKEQSLYIWKNIAGIKYIYSGACTITCFPIYYAVMPADDQKPIGFKSVYEMLQF